MATAKDINRMIKWTRKAKWGLRHVADYLLPHRPSGVMLLEGGDALLFWCRTDPRREPDFEVIDQALRHWRILATQYKYLDVGTPPLKVWVVEGNEGDLADAQTLITRACPSPAETETVIS
jgi:hypothetical protein